MDITELLVTAYQGDNPVLAVILTPGAATNLRTGIDPDGHIVVKDMSHHDTDDTFTAIRDLVQSLIPTNAI